MPAGQTVDTVDTLPMDFDGMDALLAKALRLGMATGPMSNRGSLPIGSSPKELLLLDHIYIYIYTYIYVHIHIMHMYI